jgi:hypothetical protein
MILNWSSTSVHSMWFTVHTRLSCLSFPGQTDTTPEEDTDNIVVSEPVEYNIISLKDHFNTVMILKWMHLVVWLLQVNEGIIMMRRMTAWICIDND